jgi:Putative transposase, YhgA-like
MQETTPQAEQNEEAIHHAADKGFKIMMKEKASALELMEKFVPEVYKHLDTTTFELDDTNYVNKDFEEYYSDVVYRTRLKGTLKSKRKPVAVALLFEHKKTIRSYFKLFLQLLEYMIFIWQADILNKRRPSIIIPIVIYQGSKGLRFKDLHSYFKDIPKELLQYIPNVKFHLTNVFDVPDQTLLDLNEKNLLRSLFLAYTFTDKKERIKKLLLEIFKFMAHDADKFDFFQQMFQFLSKEDVLNPDEVNELIAQYLSPQQKEGVMTTYQLWKIEGRQEGRQEGLQEGEQIKARLSVLRGKWNGWTAESLADMSELPLSEVNNLLAGYEDVYKFWTKNKGKTPKTLPKIAHLSAKEVSYLMVFFTQKQSVVSEN